MKRLGYSLIFIFTTTIVAAQGDDIRTKNFNIKKGIAIEGYDPVSFFNRKPLEGKSEFEAAYRGVIYRFASAANRNTFKELPEKYEPAFGGWCAYAMGESGDKVKIDPETFKIFDGKLYLFYNFWGNNTLTEWNTNEKLLKSKAEQNWKKFVP